MPALVCPHSSEQKQELWDSCDYGSTEQQSIGERTNKRSGMNAVFQFVVICNLTTRCHQILHIRPLSYSVHTRIDLQKVSLIFTVWNGN